MSIEVLDAKNGTARGFLEPVRRFPLPVLCALALTILNWTRFDSYSGPPYPADAGLSLTQAASYHLSPFLIASFFLSFAIALYGETTGRRVAGLIAAVIGVFLLAAMYSAWT